MQPHSFWPLSLASSRLRFLSFQAVFPLIFITTDLGLGMIIIPISQLRTLNFREVRKLFHGHTAKKRQNQDLNLLDCLCHPQSRIPASPRLASKSLLAFLHCLPLSDSRYLKIRLFSEFLGGQLSFSSLGRPWKSRDSTL